MTVAYNFCSSKNSVACISLSIAFSTIRMPTVQQGAWSWSHRERGESDLRTGSSSARGQCTSAQTSWCRGAAETGRKYSEDSRHLQPTCQMTRKNVLDNWKENNLPCFQQEWRVFHWCGASLWFASAPDCHWVQRRSRCGHMRGGTAERIPWSGRCRGRNWNGAM